MSGLGADVSGLGRMVARAAAQHRTERDQSQRGGRAHELQLTPPGASSAALRSTVADQVVSRVRHDAVRRAHLLLLGHSAYFSPRAPGPPHGLARSRDTHDDFGELLVQEQSMPAAVRLPFPRFCLAVKTQLNAPVPDPLVVGPPMI